MKQLLSAFALLVAVQIANAQDHIALIRGGGVTGNTTVYKIQRDGKVIKGSGTVDPEWSESATLRKCTTKKYFRKTRSLLEKNAFNHPGNMYTTLALVEKGAESKITWGDTAYEAPEKATRLYQKMLSSIKRLTFSKDLRK